MVVRSNPRGSSGYGRDFSFALYQGDGEKDYRDVLAGVDHAIELGYSDPDRLGVGGYSYGGILTNYIITQTDRFKGAVSGAGTGLSLANYGHDMYQRWWESEFGLPWETRELWEGHLSLRPYSKCLDPHVVRLRRKGLERTRPKFRTTLPGPSPPRDYYAARCLSGRTPRRVDDAASEGFPGTPVGLVRPVREGRESERGGLSSGAAWQKRARASDGSRILYNCGLVLPGYSLVCTHARTQEDRIQEQSLHPWIPAAMRWIRGKENHLSAAIALNCCKG